ncbi:MAG: O-antigen ligase family protein [bacterium]
MDRDVLFDLRTINSSWFKMFLVFEILLWGGYVLLNILGMGKLATVWLLAPVQLLIWALLVGDEFRILIFFTALVPVVGAAFLPPSYYRWVFFAGTMVLLGACYATSWIKGRNRFRVLSNFERIPLFMVMVVIVFSFINASNRGWHGPTLLPTTELLLELLAIGYLAARLVLDEHQIEKLLQTIVFSVVFCSVGVFWLAWSRGVASDFGSKSVLTPFGWLNLNAWGCIVAVAGIIALAFVLQRRSVLNKVALIFAIFVLVAMLILTKSRGAWLGFGLALLYVLVAFRSFKLIAILVVLLFVLSFWELARHLVFVRVSETKLTDPSLAGRVVLWTYAWNLGKSNWLLGVGMENFRFVKHLYGFPGSKVVGLPYNAHNIYLEFFADLGFFGVMSFLVLLVSALVRTYSSKFDETVPAPARPIGVALSAGLITFIVHGMVDAFTYNPGALALLIILVSLSFVFGNLKKRYRINRISGPS